MLDLEKYKHTSSPIKIGCTTKCRLSINGQDFIFKQNYAIKTSGVEEPSNFVEVLASKFLAAVGAENFVEYKYAKLNGKPGCCCKSFIDETVLHEISFLDILASAYFEQGKKSELKSCLRYGRERMLNFVDDFFNKYPRGTAMYSVEGICDEISEFCEINEIEFNQEEIENGLKKSIIYDYFLCNVDHNWTNINFLIRKKGDLKEITLAPYFDYGKCFGIARRLEAGEEPNVSSLLSFEEISTRSFFEFSKFLSDGGMLAVDIYKFMQKDDNVKNLVEKCLNTNINLLIREIEQQENLEIPKEYIDIVDESFKYRVAHFKKTINRLQQKLKTSQFEK